MRGNHDRRAMRLEIARGHCILVVLGLRLRVMIRIVPLRHLLVVGRRERRSVVLRVVVRVVGIRVVDRRVCLGGNMVVLVVALPSPGMVRHGRRVRARHHGRPTEMLPSQMGAGRRPSSHCEATGGVCGRRAIYAALRFGDGCCCCDGKRAQRRRGG